MGKKGKARQDKFYHLAKETGYRSRAAFKLLQLNRRFEFLQKSRVVVDLCAAPGSWMQVARQHMPVSSLIIGIDLFPIKPIQGCLALQEDITTEKCYQNLKKELNNWKADVVLHDGAPNVGQNWIYDAFIQNQLVLSALKLATEFLNKGGWFVTKIFRSKDYQSLMWVLQQLFKRVHSSKPHASRMESAEIFVVCQGYKAPDKLDPKFLDPKYVFQEVEADTTTVKGLFTSEKGKPKAQGYEDGVTTLHKKASVSNFVMNDKFVEILNNASEIVMDDKRIANHTLTTDEIKECCKDIKVLGRKDLKALLAWRKAIKKELEKDEEKDETPAGAIEVEEGGEDDEDEDEDLARVEQQIQELEEEKARELKRKKKKVTKERRTLQEKMRLKMVLPGDSGPELQEKSLFGLNQIKSTKDLDELADQEADLLAEEPEGEKAPRAKTQKVSKEGGRLDSSARFYREEDDSEEELEFNSDDEYESDVPQDSLGFDDDERDADGDEDEGKKKSSKKVRFAADVNKAVAKPAEEDEEEYHHPLLTDLDHSDKGVKRQRKADQWFKKGAFDSLENEEDEDIELDLMARKMKGPVTEPASEQNDDDEDEDEDDDEDDGSDAEVDDREKSESDDDSDSSDSDSDYDVHKDFKDKSKGSTDEGPAAAGKVRGKKRSLTAEALALGSMMIHSKKAKRDITDDSWCRYVSNDDNLPDWFVEDERRHHRKELPITKELVQDYRDRMKEINVRPIKKVVEAKARKKRRTVRRMEKAKKKADAIVETMGMSDYDKAQQIRHLYKKASVEKKKEVKYVVAKKHQAGPRARRPAGVQGPYKMVDRRMKKDDKRRKATERRSGKSKRGNKK